jgi:hypothetical protein
MIPKAILEERLETRALITRAKGVLDRATETMAAGGVVLDAAEVFLSEPRRATIDANDLLLLYHRWRHLGVSGDLVDASRFAFRQCADELNALLLTVAR